MSLTEYQKKRNFQKTTEPSPDLPTSSSERLRYAIQKHAASHLHYDLRLEWNGVLKSWAIPKGPSLDPEKKQLAVQVEDHPLPYADFEGTIPAGEYGGGTVMVWDQGYWTPLEDPEKGLKSGKLKFTLTGKKLQGDWALVRIRGIAGGGDKNWLLIKHRDSFARVADQYQVLEEEPLSVLTGRNIDEISQAKAGTGKSLTKRTAKQTRSSKAKSTHSNGHSTKLQDMSVKLPGSALQTQPAFMAPQLATLTRSIPSGNDWLHELKWDGYRILTFIESGKSKLMTRNGNDWTVQFPALVDELKRIPIENGILDGEVVYLCENGIPNFQKLQNAIHEEETNAIVYYLFDIPFCDGYDLRHVPLQKRRQHLKEILQSVFRKNDGRIRFSDHLQGQGEEMLAQTCQSGLEGVISKRADSFYSSGRSRDWMKIKCQKRQEFVIGGYTRPQGSRVGFGALLVGYFDEEGLRYCGRVGTGFTDDSLREIYSLLKPISSDRSPFLDAPQSCRPPETLWVEPQLVGEVEFTEWTGDNMLRHPAFKGLREDKSASEIFREDKMISSAPKGRKRLTGHRKNGTADRSLDHEVAGIAISNAERVVFSDIQFTKLQLAEFYRDIAEHILPHIVDRPLSIVRSPQGGAKPSFYQKHFEGSLPLGVRSIPIQEKQEVDDYFYIHDLAGLISLVQFGMTEVHPWGAKIDQVDRPDRIVFDLDPGMGTNWEHVVDGAGELHERLTDLGLQSFLRMSGGKGLHVVIPIQRRHTWEEVKDFSQALATSMAQDSPARYLDSMSKTRREGRVFIDYLRNSRGATTVASYSTRNRAGTPVATPLRWDELSTSLSPGQYTVLNIRERLKHLTQDPWAGFFDSRQSLSKSVLKKFEQNLRAIGASENSNS